jgi:uncharacterized membrane protein YhaH (DUF805 family)
LAINNKREKIYCEFNGRILRLLNNWWQGSLLLAFIIILIILFFNFKNIRTVCRITLEN